MIFYTAGQSAQFVLTDESTVQVEASGVVGNIVITPPNGTAQNISLRLIPYFSQLDDFITGTVLTLSVQSGLGSCGLKVDTPSNSAGIETTANNTFTKAQRGSLPTIPYASTVTLDLSASNSFNIGTLTGNITVANPSNIPLAGETQSGSIYFKQDATGSRLLTLGANFKWAGGEAGALSTAANSKDRLDYVVDQDGLINVSLATAIA